MPMTESEISYQDMQDAVKKGYSCGKCGSFLVIAWGGSIGLNKYILQCSQDISHTGITRHDKKYEKEKKEAFSMESTALMTMTETEMIQRVEMARFPQDLTVADKKLLAQVAITYGFDPLMGEVTIYQGRPFVSIDGRYRKFQETGKLDGVETRPATKQEREDWQIPEGDYFFRSEVYVKDASRPFVGWGWVRASETKPGSRKLGDNTSTFKPIQNNPQRMAEKRAEAQALRKAFHIPLPSTEDIGSPEYDVESTAIEVDKTTGEVISKPEQSKNLNPPDTRGEHAEKAAAKPAPKPETPPEPPEQVLQPSEGEVKAEVEGGLSNPAQRKKIFASAKAMGYTDEQVYTIMTTKFGVESSRNLTKEEASELIEMIERGEGLNSEGEISEEKPTEG